MAVHDMLMAAAGGTAGAVNYVDDVFSTYLYTGTGGSGQTINNGINLSEKGGLIWYKSRNVAGSSFGLCDTVRGYPYSLRSNSTSAQLTSPTGYDVTGFTSTGYTLGDTWQVESNTFNATFASWTFRKQPKFFDVVTYTGDGSSFRSIAHNLGSAPGCVIVKSTSIASQWMVFHRSTGGTKYLNLNNTNAEQTGSTIWADSAPDATNFYVGSNQNTNYNGATYVAYLFAHDAGGFGTAGTDNVISCGSCDSAATVNLGYEPQWLLIKASSTTGNWTLIDNMRGWSQDNYGQLRANTSGTEATAGNDFVITSTGFKCNLTTGTTFVYIAIRRPMKPPTTGTEVFSPIAYSGNSVDNRVYTASITPDLIINKVRNGAVTSFASSRLQGNTARLETASTSAEATGTYGYSFDANNGFKGNTVYGGLDGFNSNGYNYIAHLFKRAPGFFDEVCWTTSGTDVNERVKHNLTVPPELIIMKTRAVSTPWYTYNANLGRNYYLYLNTTAASASYADLWGTSNPTSTDFGINASVFYGSSNSLVAYLFATVAGVSKVGTVNIPNDTNNINVNCGFSTGARFVLMKRYNTTGAWYVFDTSRGITSGNDPYLQLNVTDAEVTNEDRIAPYASGFTINNGGNGQPWGSGDYIYLAIA